MLHRHRLFLSLAQRREPPGLPKNQGSPEGDSPRRLRRATQPHDDRNPLRHTVPPRNRTVKVRIVLLGMVTQTSGIVAATTTTTVITTTVTCRTPPTTTFDGGDEPSPHHHDYHMTRRPPAFDGRNLTRRTRLLLA